MCTASMQTVARDLAVKRTRQVRDVPVQLSRSDAAGGVAAVRINSVRAGEHRTATVIRVKVKPNSRNSAFGPLQDGTWVARLRSAPVDRKANEELIALVAAHFQCRKSAVSIKAGAAGRMKRVRIGSA